MEEDLVVAKSMKDELDWFSNQNRALEDKVSELVDVEKANVLMERTIVNLKKEVGDFEHEIERLESKKNKEIDRVLKENATRISKLLRRNKVVQKGIRRVSQHRWLAMVEADKTELCKRIEDLEKEKARLEEVKDKIKRMVEEMKETTCQLVQKNHVLEAEFLERLSEKSAENERILDEKIALEDLKIRMEAELKEEIDRTKVLEEEKRKAEECVNEENSKLADKIEVLERDKGVLEAQLSKKEMERNCVSLRLQKVKKTLEDEKRRLEEEKDEKISELEKRTVVLEREKAEMEAEVEKANKDKSHESDKIVEINKALVAERETIRLLEREKEASEASFLKVERERSKEIERISNEKRRLEEVKNNKISELAKRNVALEAEIVQVKKALEAAEANVFKVGKEKSEKIVRILNEKMTLQDEKNKKISEHVKTIEVLEREKAKLEAEVCKVNKDKDCESDKLVEVKKTLGTQMRRAEEAEKRHSENLKMIEVLKREKEALEADILKVDKEKSVEIVRISDEKMALQDEKRRLEEEKNKKIAEHVKAMEVLEREKAKLEAEVRKVQNGKGNESDRIVVLVKALGDQKRRADSADKQVSEFLEKIRVLERAKEALEAEFLKVDKDKRNEMETKFGQADKEKHKEIERILNEKKTMETKFCQVLSSMKRIEVLEREKKEMETKFCQVDKEKSEEIQRILNENTVLEAEKRAMKDDYEKKNLELVDRISILEREKRGLEAEIIEKDDGIKVFYEGLEDVKKDLEMEINGSASKMKEDVQLFQSVHLTDNIDMLSTPWQNEGKNTAGVAYSSEPGRSVKRKRSIKKCEELGKKIQRSAGVVDDKLVLAPCEKIKEMNSKRCTNGSNVAATKAACKWKGDQDLLDAFDASPELCLKAVCALYRQHKRLKRRNASLSPRARVLKRGYFSKAKSLATFIIDEVSVDSRMKKVVDKLYKIDVLAVGVCRNIAKEHYKQVFEIYKKKEDRLFLS